MSDPVFFIPGAALVLLLVRALLPNVTIRREKSTPKGVQKTDIAVTFPTWAWKKNGNASDETPEIRLSIFF